MRVYAQQQLTEQTKWEISEAKTWKDTEKLKYIEDHIQGALTRCIVAFLEPHIEVETVHEGINEFRRAEFFVISKEQATGICEVIAEFCHTERLMGDTKKALDRVQEILNSTTLRTGE